MQELQVTTRQQISDKSSQVTEMMDEELNALETLSDEDDTVHTDNEYDDLLNALPLESVHDDTVHTDIMSVSLCETIHLIDAVSIVNVSTQQFTTASI